MVGTLLQIFVTLTAPTAIWLLGRGYRHAACVVGLVSQIGFAGMFAWYGQWLMIVPTLLYSVVWVSNWRDRDEIQNR